MTTRIFPASFAGTGFHWRRGGQDIQGTWKTTARHLCWTWIKPRGSEECYEVDRSRNDVRLFRNGYEALSGTLTPIVRKQNKAGT